MIGLGESLCPADREGQSLKITKSSFGLPEYFPDEDQHDSSHIPAFALKSHESVVRLIVSKYDPNTVVESTEVTN